MHEDAQFAVYNGSPMRTIDKFGSAGRYIYPGTAIRVTSDIRFRLLGWLNGSASEQSYFTPIDEAYFNSLPYCAAVGCGVAFANSQALEKHARAHEYVEAHAPELEELRRLEAEAAADRQLVEDIRTRRDHRIRRVVELNSAVEAGGFRAVIQQPEPARERKRRHNPKRSQTGVEEPTGGKARKHTIPAS